jgi:hypothetical protein
MNAIDLIKAGDEQSIDDAFFDESCVDFFAVDWGEADFDIIELCEMVIATGKLSAGWKGDDLFIHYGNVERRVPLTESEGDRHVTICLLNDVLAPDFEIRYVIASYGGDTIGFCVLPKNLWNELEQEYLQFINADFIDPRALPNIVTELVDANLPPLAKARVERMVARNTR